MCSVSIVPEAPIEIVAVLYSKLGEYITAICADQVCARLSFELAHSLTHFSACSIIDSLNSEMQSSTRATPTMKDGTYSLSRSLAESLI